MSNVKPHSFFQRLKKISDSTLRTERQFYMRQHRPGRAGLKSALITPERRILSWEGAGRTEWRRKSLLFSAFTQCRAALNLHYIVRTCGSESDTLQPRTHPHSHEQRGLGSTSRATSDEKPSKEEREKTTPLYLSYKSKSITSKNDILSSLMQRETASVHSDT